MLYFYEGMVNQHPDTNISTMGHEGEQVSDGRQSRSSFIGVESTARARLSGTLDSLDYRQSWGVDAEREWSVADDDPLAITSAYCTDADSYQPPSLLARASIGYPS